jgi:hypothetical protein
MMNVCGVTAFCQKSCRGLKKAVFPVLKVGVLVLGLEVPHAHIHLVPMQNEADLLNFTKKQKFTPESFKEITETISKIFNCKSLVKNRLFCSSQKFSFYQQTPPAFRKIRNFKPS